MTDLVYQKIVRRWMEVTDLPPQTLGPFTPYYKAITKRLKVMPWPALVGASLIIIIGLFLILGSTISFIVSILQRGF